MEKYGKNKPGLVSVGIRIRKFYYVNIEPTQLSDETWKWESIALEPGEPCKEEIIEKLVNLKYPTSKVASIGMGYLSGQDDLGIRFEFEALQAWKEEASKIADKVIETIHELEGNA